MTKPRRVESEECCPSVWRRPSPTTMPDIGAPFAALADPVRLKLLSLIGSCDEVCAGELVEPVGRSQPTVSHHLKQLFEAGLVARERRGTWIWYRIVDEQIAAMRDALVAPAAVAHRS